MKRLIAFFFLFVCLCVPGAIAQSKSSDGIDQSTMRLSIEDLRRRLIVAKDDQAAMYVAVMSAKNERQWPPVLATLKTLIKKYPDNGIVRAGYVLAYQMHVKFPEDAKEPMQVRVNHYASNETLLYEAERVSPGLWLTKIADAPSRELPTQLNLLRQAEKLAPDVAITHYQLAETYLFLGINPHTYTSVIEKVNVPQNFAQTCLENARKEYDMAVGLKPVLSEPYLGLMYMSIRYFPDEQKAASYWNQYLQTLPPENRKTLNERQQKYVKLFEDKFKKRLTSE